VGSCPWSPGAGRYRRLAGGLSTLWAVHHEDVRIIDDLMVANTGDHFFLVVNAACKDQERATSGSIWFHHRKS
jgi:glycine cleavage system aminomethyltransferase T